MNMKHLDFCSPGPSAIYTKETVSEVFGESKYPKWNYYIKNGCIWTVLNGKIHYDENSRKHYIICLNVLLCWLSWQQQNYFFPTKSKTSLLLNPTCFNWWGCHGSHSLTGALGIVTHNNILLALCLYGTIQQLQQQLQQQQNLNLQQFVLVQPGHPIATQLQPTQFFISQTPQGQQSEFYVILTFSDLSGPPCDQPIWLFRLSSCSNQVSCRPRTF